MAALSPMMLDGSTQKNGKRRKLVTSIKSLEKWVGRTEETRRQGGGGTGSQNR
jgi:hypothetical protein